MAFGGILDAPIWAVVLGFALVAILGALAAWLYATCAAAERRGRAQDRGDVAQALLAASQEEAAELRKALDKRKTELSEVRALLTEASSAPAPDPAAASELTAARERLTAAEARAAALSAETDAAQAETSTLRYRLWLQERDATRTAVGAIAAPAASAAALSLTRRAVAAAKMGRLSELADIEREIETAARQGGVDAPPPPSGPQPDDPSGLRYRNWVLAGALREAMPDAPPSAQPAMAAALARAETRSAPSAAITDAPSAPPAPAVDADSAPDAAPQPDDAAGLRYRNWRLGGVLAQVVDASRAGAEIDADAAAAALAAARVAEGPDDAEPLAPIATLGDRSALMAASTLRARVAQLEGAIAGMTSARAADASAAAASASAARDESAALRTRAAQAEAGLRAVRAAAPSAGPPTAALIDAAVRSATAGPLDEAGALRRRANQAEGALRAARADAARAAAAAEEIVDLRAKLLTAEWRAADAAAAADARPSDDALRAAGDDADALRRRAGQAEAALRAARAAAKPVAAAPVSAALSDPSAAEALRARLAASEAEIQRLRAAVATTPTDPQLRAEVETLRARLRAMPAQDAGGADAATLERHKTEAETLRARLALAEQEIGRLKTGPARPSAPAPALLDGARSTPEPIAFSDAELATIESYSGPIDIAGPLSGVEVAAEERIAARAALIAQGSAVDDPPPPPGLLADPADGPRDDLKLIQGVGPNLETLLNRQGIFYFKQIAELGPDDVAWLDARLQLAGRVTRHRWLPQAQRWRARKAATDLEIGPEGSWTLPRRVDAPPAPAPAIPEAADAQLHVTLDTPLTGVEAAALEWIEGRRGRLAAERPASWPTAPADAPSDDLTRIAGVGPQLAGLLNAMGVRTYRQIAQLAPEEMAWLDRRIGGRGRVVRQRWAPQAQLLADAAEPRAAEARIPAPTPATPAPLARRAEPAPARPTSPPAPAPAPQTLPAATEPQPTSAETAAAALLADGYRPDPSDSKGVVSPGPVRGAPDDLTEIDRISADDARKLNGLGVFYFSQLADAGPRGLAWLDATLGLGGRVVREGWARRAGAAAAGKSAGGPSLGTDGGGATVAPPAATATAAAAVPMRATRTPQAPAAEPGSGDPKTAPHRPEEIEALRLLETGFQATAENRPAILDEPIAGPPDSLQQIDGVGPKLEALLHEMGVRRFEQIARFTGRDIAWLDAKLRFRGRIVRDRWLIQADRLSRGEV